MRTSFWGTVTGRLSRRSTQIITAITLLAIVGLVAGGLFYARQKAYAAPGVGCDVNAQQNTPTCTYNGLTAAMNLNSWSPDGCIVTYVNVIASQGFTNNPSFSLQSGNGVDVMIIQNDYCNQVELSLATGQANNINFTADSSLNTASLNTTVTVTDWDSPTQATYPVTVNLTWQGIGPSGRTISSTQSIAGSWVFNTRYNGTTRSAQVSGSITSDTMLLNETTPNLDGMLSNATGGQIFVTHF